MIHRPAWLHAFHLLAGLTLLLAACESVTPGETALPGDAPPTARELTTTPSPACQPLEPTDTRSTISRTPGPTGTPGEAELVIEQARTDLARRLALNEAQIRIVSVETVQWPDSSLGCPKPGMHYLMVITPGYRIRLEAADRFFEYHSGRTDVVYCEQPTDL